MRLNITLLLVLLWSVVIQLTTVSAHRLDAGAQAAGNTDDDDDAGDVLNGISKRLSKEEATLCISQCRALFDECGKSQKRVETTGQLFTRCCMGGSGFIQCSAECGATSIR